MKIEWWAEPNGSSTLIYCRFPVGDKVGGAYHCVSHLELAYSTNPKTVVYLAIQRVDEQRKFVQSRASDRNPS